MELFVPIGHRIALGGCVGRRFRRRCGVIPLLHCRSRAGRTDDLVHPGPTGQRIEIPGSLDLDTSPGLGVVLLAQQILLGLPLGLSLLGGGRAALVHPRRAAISAGLLACDARQLLGLAFLLDLLGQLPGLGILGRLGLLGQPHPFLVVHVFHMPRLLGEEG
jgi:hypothetical protein